MVEPIEGVSDTVTLAGGQPPVNNFEIPEAYKEKTYLKDVNSLDDVYKKLDGAQTLIGQRVQIPTAETPEVDRNAFYKSLGVPEKAEEYVFNKIGDQERNVEIDGVMKSFLHKYNIPAETATAMQGELEAMAADALKNKTTEDGKQADIDFDKISSEIFGEKADQIIADSKKLIEENLPKELGEAFNKLSNENLIIMTSVLENFRKKYISEDEINKGGPAAQGQTKESLNAEVTALMNNPAYKDGMHKDHADVRSKVTALCNLIAKFEG